MAALCYPDERSVALPLPGVDIARSARLRNVIFDCGVRIPEALAAGEAPELDARRFRRSESRITLITRPMLDKLGG
jgi:glucose-1-phosphate adenylyltransferase